MKRSIVAVVCLLGLAIAASVSYADMNNPHWAIFPLSFRTQATAATIADPRSKLIPSVAAGGVISFGTASYIDSVTFQHVGQGNAVAETTIAFPTQLIAMARATSPSDSGNVVLQLWDTGANCAGCSGTGTIDSLYCNFQVSDDGATWVTSSETLLPMANGATTNAKFFQRKFSGNCTVSSGTVANNGGLGCYSFWRWIVYDDGSNATAIHNFRGQVRYTSANSQDNR